MPRRARWRRCRHGSAGHRCWSTTRSIVLLLVIPLSGWIYSSSTGVQVVYLGLVPLPDLVPKDRELARALLILHLTLNFTLVFTGLCPYRGRAQTPFHRPRHGSDAYAAAVAVGDPGERSTPMRLRSFIPSLGMMLLAAGQAGAEGVLIDKSEIRFVSKQMGINVEGTLPPVEGQYRFHAGRPRALEGRFRYRARQHRSGQRRSRKRGQAAVVVRYREVSGRPIRLELDQGRRRRQVRGRGQADPEGRRPRRRRADRAHQGRRRATASPRARSRSSGSITGSATPTGPTPTPSPTRSSCGSGWSCRRSNRTAAPAHGIIAARRLLSRSAANRPFRNRGVIPCPDSPARLPSRCCSRSPQALPPPPRKATSPTRRTRSHRTRSGTRSFRPSAATSPSRPGRSRSIAKRKKAAST